MADFFPADASSLGGAATSGAGDKRLPGSQQRVRRRNRLITSCLECRRRKLKCDKSSPCTNCIKFNRACHFLGHSLDPVGQAKLAEVKEKMGMLERTLEDDVARRTEKSRSGSASASGSALSPPNLDPEQAYSDQEDLPEDERDLEVTTLAVEDAAYYEGEDNDEIVDLGIQMGRMRINERIGGFVRPRFTDELAAALKELPPSAPTGNPFAEQSPDTWMAPGPDYIAPSSSFFFAPGVHKTSLMAYLPSRAFVDKFMAHYWRAVHVVARTVHRPSFERQYEQFWIDVTKGNEPRVSFQAVVFAALLSSVISMPDDMVVTDYGVPKETLVESFKTGSEGALARANFLRTTKLETLQAFVMYLIPLCRAEVSRAHSALTGTLIRLAECMGLHRDPSQYTSSPREIHVRRLIWYQICFLDLRTCEATGPRPQIRRDEFDTKFPLNIHDVDLDNADWQVKAGGKINELEDANHFTDMTITRMRFECYEMHRELWILRPQLDQKKVTLTYVLSRIQAFKAKIEKTYLPILSKHHPLHVMAMEIYGILSNRMYVMVLQKFTSNDKRLMPERLRTIVLSTAVLILEHSMLIETTPALSTWSWYVGAFHQYHTALLLLHELYSKKRDPVVEARVWKCLDFCFDLPAGLNGGEKSRMILEELIERTRAFQAMRKVRVPKAMRQVGPRIHSPETETCPPQDDTATRDFRSMSRGSNSGISSSGFTNLGSSASPPQTNRDHSHSPQHYQIQPNQFQQTPQQQYQHLSTGTNPLPNIRLPENLDFSGLGMNTMLPDSRTGQGYGGIQQTGSTTAPTFGIPTTAADPNVSPLQASVGMSPVMRGNSSDSGGSSAAMPALGSGGSPMDIMPDIDWTEWEKLFPASETDISAGDFMIPPFTFPQFTPADLQWGAEGMQ
ncbi:hypothetical protein P154DRAFT_522586 [Amniculicola lignicola CBS 123094]|uniref:Zn(2)-C6 fungal-type domain-containing protein n=1 Tax=Amniculicola lignicola CBS 123094 TaxID=1392246 RepID=A0A6A5WS60_9PLEO|nr:hypothetical protein P154DRAFT_522586 [Amniculicola lignicola CBS 123094]